VAAAESGAFLLRFIARIGQPQGLGVCTGGPKAAGPPSVLDGFRGPNNLNIIFSDDQAWACLDQLSNLLSIPQKRRSVYESLERVVAYAPKWLRAQSIPGIRLLECAASLCSQHRRSEGRLSLPIFFISRKL
jgi:hypothetical protein